MKVRWTDSSIRLRITPTELALLSLGKSVTAHLAFPNGGWQIEILPNSSQTNLDFAGTSAQVFLTGTDLERLMVPDAEGVYFKTPTEPSLRYFIEKDFPCAHPRAADALEEPTLTFDAPDGFEARK